MLKNQDEELLNKGHIIESINLYVILVLLVLKKDGIWCMGVNNLIINKITIKYSNFIPRLYAMLDKLNGFYVF